MLFGWYLLLFNNVFSSTFMSISDSPHSLFIVEEFKKCKEIISTFKSSDMYMAIIKAPFELLSQSKYLYGKRVGNNASKLDLRGKHSVTVMHLKTMEKEFYEIIHTVNHSNFNPSLKSKENGNKEENKDRNDSNLVEFHVPFGDNVEIHIGITRLICKSVKIIDFYRQLSNYRQFKILKNGANVNAIKFIASADWKREDESNFDIESIYRKLFLQFERGLVSIVINETSLNVKFSQDINRMEFINAIRELPFIENSIKIEKYLRTRWMIHIEGFSSSKICDDRQLVQNVLKLENLKFLFFQIPNERNGISKSLIPIQIFVYYSSKKSRESLVYILENQIIFNAEFGKKYFFNISGTFYQKEGDGGRGKKNLQPYILFSLYEERETIDKFIFEIKNLFNINMIISHQNNVRMIMAKEKEVNDYSLSTESFDCILTAEKEYLAIKALSFTRIHYLNSNSNGTLRMIKRSSIEMNRDGNVKLNSCLFRIFNATQNELFELFKEAFKALSYNKSIIRIGILHLPLMNTQMLFIDHFNNFNLANKKSLFHLFRKISTRIDVKMQEFEYKSMEMNVNLYELFAFITSNR